MQKLILTLGLIGVLFINLKADEVEWETITMDKVDGSYGTGTNYVCPLPVKSLLKDSLYDTGRSSGAIEVLVYESGKYAISDKPITAMAKEVEAYGYVQKFKKLDEKIGQEFIEYAKKLRAVKFKIAQDVCVSESKTRYDYKGDVGVYTFFEQPKKTLDEFFKTIDSYFE
ncbi:hypothetical protein OQH61_03955 [Helicobacter sp. MIT 21-1697]|uniref:hypothetical protein n=1 Tax=Helicobacter sp. MIT 21-1697 TaxID=2993733 RepID=UPI00224B5BE9|nr:hypothetical protein [Helicobacter sp. MIT 21-1697]MCX2716885.1 hypothetical protein [Helicobacter sp. MIT 21-1697]